MRHMGLNSVSRRLGKHTGVWRNPKEIVTSVNRPIVYAVRDFEWPALKAWLTEAISIKGQTIYYNKMSRNFMVQDNRGGVSIPFGYKQISEKLLFKMEDK